MFLVGRTMVHEELRLRRQGRRGRRILPTILLFALIVGVTDVEARTCTCTSKACKEAGVDTCATEFSCYTELIVTIDQEVNESSITRGCTEGATPLLCETKSWVTRSKSAARMPWPRLKCCDTHDYCNDEHHVDVSTWGKGKDGKRIGAVDRSEENEEDDVMGDLGGDDGRGGAGGDPQEDLRYKNAIRSMKDEASSGTVDQYRGGDQHLQHRVRPLHVAALILAIAALISVLAACYVITRFLRSHPYVVGNVVE